MKRKMARGRFKRNVLWPDEGEDHCSRQGYVGGIKFLNVRPLVGRTFCAKFSHPFPNRFTQETICAILTLTELNFPGGNAYGSDRTESKQSNHF